MAKCQPRDHDIPSEVEIVAGLVSGTAQTETINAVRSVSYRVPIHLLARIDAMAELAGKSRNAMLNAVVSAGLDEVEKVLPSDVLANVQERSWNNLQALIGDTESLAE